jgi:hypothetical protein
MGKKRQVGCGPRDNASCPERRTSPLKVRPLAMARDLKPIVEPAPIPTPTAVWNQTDWETIQRGHEAQDMDEHWEILCADERIDVHRSWTGRCIYRAWFEPTEGGWRIAKAEVTGSEDVYRRGSDELEQVQLECIIRVVLLDDLSDELRSRWSNLR